MSAPTAAARATRPTFRRSVRGSDPDEGASALSSGFEGTAWRMEPTLDEFAWRHSFLGDEDLALSALRVDGRLVGQGAAMDQHVVSWLRTGRPLDIDEPHATVGRPTILPTDRVADMGYLEFDQRCVHLSRDVVRRVAEERAPLGPGSPLVLAQPATLDAAATRRWWSTVQLVSGHLTSPAGTSALLRAELARSAAAAFLDLFPVSSAVEVPSLLLPRNAHIREAVEYLHAHAHEPITTEDLARVAHLGVRALQQAFVRHLDLTPTAYLRRVRIERCRDDLLAAHPDETMVADVARHWGFAHLGRFAATYHQHVGEYPRETLARRR